jgi:hypothetical protein
MMCELWLDCAWIDLRDAANSQGTDGACVDPAAK